MRFTHRYPHSKSASLSGSVCAFPCPNSTIQPFVGGTFPSTRTSQLSPFNEHDSTASIHNREGIKDTHGFHKIIRHRGKPVGYVLARHTCHLDPGDPVLFI